MSAPLRPDGVRKHFFYMKKTNPIRNMAAAALAALFCCVMMLSSCSKNSTADAEALLKTVPSNATLVALANLERMSEKAGDKISDVVNKFGKTSAQANDVAPDGIAETYMVVFTDGLRTYATGIIDKEDDFTAAIEKAYGAKFAEQDGAKVCGQCVVVNDQFWIVIDGTPDVATIRAYPRLSENQSFFSDKYAETMIESDDDFTAICNLAGLLNLAGGANGLAAQAATGSLFSDARFIVFDLDFEKGKAVLDAKVLDGKYKPAKFLLPLPKIDSSVVAALEGSGVAVAALAVSKEMLDKIEKVLSSFPGLGMTGGLLDTFKPLDGTSAAAIGADGNVSSIIISTDGNPGSLIEAAKSLANVPLKKDGKLLKGAAGGSGPLVPSAQAKHFDGAWFGFVVDGSLFAKENPGLDGKISLFSFMAKPEKGSLEFDLTIFAKDQNQNFLKAMK